MLFAEEIRVICGNVAEDMTTVVLSFKVLFAYAYRLLEIIKLG
jgi:hypothetical protein